jgi:hypothetical protein
MSNTRRESYRDTLIRLVNEADIKLWMGTGNAEEIEFATINEGGIQKHHTLKSRDFRAWLIRGFYNETGQGPNNQALQEALSTLSARALHEGVKHQTWVRVGESHSTIYLDLADDQWKAISINASGFSVIPNPPIKFTRCRGMKTLPEPCKGGQLPDLLGRFLNVESRDDLALISGWLVVAAQPNGPFPVLALHGEQGTAKSTTARVCRALLDPNAAPIKTTPRDERDLVLAGKNNWMLILDNLSGLPIWLSDGLARIATGAGFSTRQLYSDTDETVIAITRPICINGIDDCVSRGDLLDRSFVINLKPIPPQNRKPEKQFWREFESAHPALLGAICEALSISMSNEGRIKYPFLPRMADAAMIAANAAPAWGMTPAEWLEIYDRNRKGAVEASLDGSPIATSIRILLSKIKHWKGTSTELLTTLNLTVESRVRVARGWPKEPRILSIKLRRLAPMLRQSGINVDFYRSQGERIIHLEIQCNPTSTASPMTPSDVADDEIQMARYALGFEEENTW